MDSVFTPNVIYESPPPGRLIIYLSREGEGIFVIKPRFGMNITHSLP
nr:MAG TPA: hypothetical protein [Caudoviricetes sp.]